MSKRKVMLDYVLTVSLYVALFILIYAVQLGCLQIGGISLNPASGIDPFENLGVFKFFDITFNTAVGMIGIPAFAAYFFRKEEKKLYKDFKYRPYYRSVPRAAMIVEIILIVALSVIELSVKFFRQQYDIVEPIEVYSYIICPILMIIISVSIYKNVDEYFYEEDCRIEREKLDNK